MFQVGRQNHQLGDAETAIGQYQNALQQLTEAIDFREKAKMAVERWLERGTRPGYLLHSHGIDGP